MRNKPTSLLLALLAVMSISFNLHSQSAVGYIAQTYPGLYGLYEEDLKNLSTHYIFAIDVSGSMNKYDDIVTPALKAFVDALPYNEQVSVIPFGTDAKENTPGLCAKIESNGQKDVLKTALSTLYKNDGYSKEFRGNTDAKKAAEAVNKTILNNQQAQMNVVVIITDFLNDLPGVGEQKLFEADLTKLNNDFNNVTNDKYTRVVALQLPKAGTGEGFCLDQLQEKVYNNTSPLRKFDVVPAIKDERAISHWFEQLSRDIMTDKLKAIIYLDNERNLQPSITTETDIDGNTIAEIHWAPNRLYKQIKIDGITTADGSDYIFTNKEEALKTTEDADITKLKIGKLAHKEWGLRKYNEVLNLGLSLPTEYDDELSRLSIEKPKPATSDKKSGWLFTFFLPFWLTVSIALAILLYIILVIKAYARNKRERFKGTVDFDDTRRDIGDTISVILPASKTLLIGESGTNGCDLAGAQWTIKVKKKTPSPFLFWKRPAFEWSAKSGFVKDNRNKRSGLLGRYGKSNTKSIVHLDCGPDWDNITHGVKIKIRN